MTGGTEAQTGSGGVCTGLVVVSAVLLQVYTGWVTGLNGRISELGPDFD